MKRRVTLLSAALFLAAGASAQAASPQDPSVGGQLNQCWGQIASQVAQLDTPDGTSGGGMGQHSRSTQAANTNGGFASDSNAFGITFNVDGGRTGVGNVSNGAPHSTHPGDGGNGQHAINNSSDTENGLGLSTVLNPVTGELTTAVGGSAEVVDLRCDQP